MKTYHISTFGNLNLSKAVEASAPHTAIKRVLDNPLPWKIGKHGNYRPTFQLRKGETLTLSIERTD